MKMIVAMAMLSAGCLAGICDDKITAAEFLGERYEAEIRTGCVVSGGQYIAPPYVVGRSGNEILINGRVIRRFVPWPVPKPIVRGVTEVMPEVPEGIDENSSLYDGKVIGFRKALLDHLIYLGVTNRAERYAAEMRKLPCVADAEPESTDNVVVFWRNETQGFTCNLYPERHDHRGAKWPRDKKALQEIGDGEVANLTLALRADSFLLLPGEDCQIEMSGSGVDRIFFRMIGLIDKGFSPAEICESLREDSCVSDSLCEAVVKHRQSFGESYFSWVNRHIVEPDAERERAAAERKKLESARKRAAEERARREAEEQAPTVEWTPEAARKGGVRFYEYYRSLRYSGEPFVPYAFWPRSTQPGDKWKFALREDAQQAFSGFLSVVEETNVKIQEDVAAGCRSVGGQLRPETIQWSISCDFPVAKDEPVGYARIPMLVSANLNPAYLLREWDGLKNARKVIPLGPSFGAVKSLFDDACAVIVFNDGTAEMIPAKELTYARIYRRAFKGPPLLGYLTVRGFVEPKGVDK